MFAAPARAEIDQLQASYDFLVTERTAGGVLTAVAGHTLPLSFYDTAAYWGGSVCKYPGTTCAVTDTYNAATYQVTPEAGAAGDLQTERVNVHNGLNIYDVAVWQIAVVLGKTAGKLTLPPGRDAYALASAANEMLDQSGKALAGGGAPGTQRATSTQATFMYNGHAIGNAKQAFAFRMMAPAWLATDPLMDSPYASLITARGLPWDNPAYKAGKITWTDWKPITGENAWAFLVGPLQAANIHYTLEARGGFVPFEARGGFVPFRDRAVQNALDVLPTFAAMQSAIGGVYYAPLGTVGNQGDQPVSPYEVSVENNVSLYAGLRVLRATLTATLSSDATLVGSDKTRIAAALRMIDVMIDGGRVGDNKPTAGLLSFFKTAAWQDGAFVQSGRANDPVEKAAWVPVLKPRAVDVTTWGIAALGTKQVDAWFGFGAAFDAWQRLKGWGAFGAKSALLGVGYSDQDGNGMTPDGTYRSGVLSGEWTAGAITMVRNMMETYGAVPTSSSQHAAALTFIAGLKADEAAMLDGVQALRMDRYPSAALPNKPENLEKLIPLRTRPYLYASQRYRIPFGWIANPVPSTASTAWMILVANRYDPFGIGGRPN